MLLSDDAQKRRGKKNEKIKKNREREGARICVYLGVLFLERDKEREGEENGFS